MARISDTSKNSLEIISPNQQLFRQSTDKLIAKTSIRTTRVCLSKKHYFSHFHLPAPASNRSGLRHVLEEVHWPMSRQAQPKLPCRHCPSPSNQELQVHGAVPTQPIADHRHSQGKCDRTEPSVDLTEGEDLKNRPQTRSRPNHGQQTRIENCGCNHARSGSALGAAIGDGNRGTHRTSCCRCEASEV